MNLKALFNFNYFKENIRKSKGLLAFLLGVIPIVNIIFLIVLLTNSSSNLLTLKSVSYLTYLGIIFIPIALSLTLFGFVFKKKSVDFVMSKPLNRRSIFITNTLGGIFIIFLFMLLNTLIFGLFSLIFKGLTIPLLLLIDYFIFWFICYTFIFIVSNLAIALTGNFITSLVVLLLILLITPYFNIVNYLIEDSKSNINYITCNNEECKPDKYYCYGDDSCEEHLKNNEYELYYNKKITYNFIAPLSIANSNLYNIISMIKMLALSIIYGIIGYFVFKKRKMENNETSFKSNKAHYIVKSLTFIPICFICYVIIRNANNIGWLVSIAGIIIYSGVYDLITKKELYKPVKSLVISLIIFLGLILFYKVQFSILQGTEKVITNVDSITFNGMEITDKKTNDYIIKSLLEKTSSNYSYTDNLIFKADNQEYIVNANINSDLYKYLIIKLSDWNKEKSLNLNSNKIDYIIYNDTMIPVTNKIKKAIANNINNINKFDYSTLDERDKVYIYSYQHHKYEKLIIPIKLCNELYEAIINYQNNEFIKYITKISYEPYYQLYAYTTNKFSDEDYYMFNYVINSNKTAFLNFLKNSKVDINKESISVEVYYNKSYKFTINDIEAFKEEFEKYKENIKDNPEYQNLLKSYQETESYDEAYEY